MEGGWEAQEGAGVELQGRRGKKADFEGFLAEQAEANSYADRRRRRNSLCFWRVLLLFTFCAPFSLGALPTLPPASSLPVYLPCLQPPSLHYRSSPPPFFIGTHLCSPLASQGLGGLSSSSIKTSWLTDSPGKWCLGQKGFRSSSQSLPSSSGSEHH